LADEEDKTEDATPRRLQRARESGNVPISREMATLVALTSLYMLMSNVAPGMAERLTLRLSIFLAEMARIDMSDNGVGALAMAARAGAVVVLPVILAVAAVAIISMGLQTGFMYNPTRLIPDFARLDPKRGWQKIFGVNNLVELGKSLLKVSVAGAICWRVVAAGLPGLLQAPSWDANVLARHLDRQMLQVLFAILSLQLLVGLGDLAWVRYRYARDMRMSRFDVRQEQKDSDGDPRIKRRLRQIRLMRARKRMRDGVKRATVVITNPTHYAVALRYQKTENAAPVVVAKGVDSMAARIREAAGEFGVPLVANPPLARALYKVEIDAQIPPDHYRAVAEVIAYVWRLQRRGRSAA
jgi:flagellar biosynthetic protein FlhB